MNQKIVSSPHHSIRKLASIYGHNAQRRKAEPRFYVLILQIHIVIQRFNLRNQ